MYRVLVLMMCLVFAVPSFAQDEEETENYGNPPKRGYRHNILFDIHAPHIIFNPANARAFDGIAGGSLGYSVTVFKKFTVGIVTRYDGFIIYNPKFNAANILSTTLSAGINLGYEFKLADRFVCAPQLNAGASWIHYANIPKPKNHLDDIGFSAQLNAGFYYYVRTNQRMAIGIVLGANYFSHQFKLVDTGLEGDGDLFGYSDDGPTIHLNLGLGFITKFGKIN